MIKYEQKVGWTSRWKLTAMNRDTRRKVVNIEMHKYTGWGGGVGVTRLKGIIGDGNVGLPDL